MHCSVANHLFTLIGRLWFAGFGIFVLQPALGASDEQAQAALGERIYIEGRLSSGDPVIGTTQGDIAFSGEQISCISCHRRSGYGSSEGGNYVLPITGPTLYSARDLDRARLFKKLYQEIQPKRFWTRIRSPQVRPAYSDETLARAIREGIDPTGRELDPLMPRYQLDDAEMANLIAYLKSLSVDSDPGVDDKTIHFATVVSKDADPGERDAMLKTLKAFVEWMNLDTQGHLNSPNFSPNHQSEFRKAWRLWDLQVWELDGEAETWGEQLSAYYRKQPVFAVISGLVSGAWQPVHEFCGTEKVPCLFPHTVLPATDEDNVYSVHFTRGLTLEAEVVGRYLIAEQEDDAAKLRVIQLDEAGPYGTVPANALAQVLKASDTVQIEQQSFTEPQALQHGIERIAKDGSSIGALVVWPGSDIDKVFESLAKWPQLADRVFLPSSALEAIPHTIPAELEKRLYFSYPHEVPDAYHPRAFRVRGWMRTRKLEMTHPRIQFNTYFALTAVQSGLMHIVDNFSRDYLLEYIEHSAENSLNPGTYPHLSLGPGQRFASKGAYIVKPTSGGKHPIASVSDWIVP